MSPQRTQRTQRTQRGAIQVLLCIVGVLGGQFALWAQEPSGPQAVSPAQLKAAIDKEHANSVRRAFVRARAALGGDRGVQQRLSKEVGSGEDFFRSAVIEALGDYKAQYAYEAITAVAKLDGPLQDDAALALGKI